jgi:hypothetical protein
MGPIRQLLRGTSIVRAATACDEALELYFFPVWKLRRVGYIHSRMRLYIVHSVREYCVVYIFVISSPLQVRLVTL